MSEILYEANPSMVRSNPFGTLLGVLLIPAGIGILILLYLYVMSKADHLVIKSDEIVWTHGLLSKQYTEINMAQVRTVRINQSILQRLLNAGNVEIYTAGDDPEMRIKGMPEPDKIRDFIKGQAA